MITTCPKCGYQRQSSDSHVVAGVCPSCGIAYKKWLERQALQQAQQDPEGDNDLSIESEPSPTFSTRLREQFLYVPDKVDPLSFWGRAFLFGVFFIWGWSFILGGISWVSIGGSFLHNVILPFHEFGHVLFSPFGRFMSILGGSLFQVIMPLGLMLAFSIKQRDNFAASIMLWWSGQSFIDVSPYIADAPYRAIPLIRGLGESAHDWGNLLTMTNSLDSAWTYAQISFGIGTLLILCSYGWGAWLLYQQKQRMSD
ncbi:hypothetical protein HBA55_24030 [Pseudomaricurvus alkylphenolicus]|uniref:hypothetical protein n=1 Tax=Pseudomaricurvus alkylphenolicus TaxID=1306991 RepID=UPI00141EE426|nr:hypothetical protein [Pseudomaricurvus alkylphenolicus]NIB42697.1 hypothetical protein [Pseudomaricurvus alkylphenolicus]